VREFSVPATTEVGPDEALTDMLVENVTRHGDETGLRRRVDGRWVDVSWRQFGEEVRGVAKGLIAAGVAAGDRVALQARTRYEWTVLDFAIWTAGGVVVPVYETSSPDQVAWILSDSGATAIVVERDEHAAAVESVRDQAPALEAVFVIEDDAVGTLTVAGQDVPDSELDARRATLSAESPATLIYTSGTTGRPKGCELTHRNFLFEIGNGITLLDRFMAPGGSLLLFIPLAHVLARVLQVGAVRNRTVIGHTPDVRNLVEDLGEFKPTFVLAVPRVFEKVYNSAKAKAEGDGKGKIFDRPPRWPSTGPAPRTPVARAWRCAPSTPCSTGSVYGKLRAALGGRCLGAISGGAPLGERLGHFFRGIGVTVFEGYGLTETTAAASVNHDGALRIGTVGRPLPGVGFAIAEDGEILIRGGIVMRGYWQNETATKEAIDADGWFHSGDLGEIDADGFVKITGRKKEILVTAGGKNVAPPCSRTGCAPTVWSASASSSATSAPSSPRWSPSTRRPCRCGCRPRARTRASPRPSWPRTPTCSPRSSRGGGREQGVSQAEAIKKFQVLGIDFTEDNGMLTPSLKLKRSVVLKEFDAEVEALYSR
jgi:long-chain acyl-CoA synthetase